MRHLLALLFFCTLIPTFSQTTDVCVTTEEMELYKLIMAYRKQEKLSKIPLSKSLSYVAHQHAWDLQNNNPNNEKCNLHSWSNKGPWSSCCYTPDHKQALCMWSKPREITTYKGDGFEISSWSSEPMKAADALEIWKNSEHHNNVILNKDIWADAKWNAIGIAINGSYAVVWFGKDTDEEGEPENCE